MELMSVEIAETLTNDFSKAMTEFTSLKEKFGYNYLSSGKKKNEISYYDTFKKMKGLSSEKKIESNKLKKNSIKVNKREKPE